MPTLGARWISGASFLGEEDQQFAGQVDNNACTLTKNTRRVKNKRELSARSIGPHTHHERRVRAAAAHLEQSPELVDALCAPARNKGATWSA
ncbi:MAG: hypothetical protein ACKVPX_16095 [Myxococcaceae bacterium]